MLLTGNVKYDYLNQIRTTAQTSFKVFKDSSMSLNQTVSILNLTSSKPFVFR